MDFLVHLLKSLFWFCIIGLPANFILYLVKNPDEKNKLVTIITRYKNSRAGRRKVGK